MKELSNSKILDRDVIQKVCEIVKNDLNKTNLRLDDIDFITSYDT